MFIGKPVNFRDGFSHLEESSTKWKSLIDRSDDETLRDEEQNSSCLLRLWLGAEVLQSM